MIIPELSQELFEQIESDWYRLHSHGQTSWETISTMYAGLKDADKAARGMRDRMVKEILKAKYGKDSMSVFYYLKQDIIRQCPPSA